MEPIKRDGFWGNALFFVATSAPTFMFIFASLPSLKLEESVATNSATSGSELFNHGLAIAGILAWVVLTILSNLVFHLWRRVEQLEQRARQLR